VLTTLRTAEEVPWLWLLARLRLSVELSSELWLLSSRIWHLSDPLRLRIDWRLPQLQRSALQLLIQRRNPPFPWAADRRTPISLAIAALSAASTATRAASAAAARLKMAKSTPPPTPPNNAAVPAAPQSMQQRVSASPNFPLI